jgi:anti-anti-sigma regulatory factor
VSKDSGEARLILEGDISAEWVPVLEQQCLELLEQRKNRVVLDFEYVMSVDRRGIRMLRELSSRHCQFVACSPVVADLLERG